MVRERARGKKFESTYRRRKGVITKETPHTITMKETNKKGQTTFSKRDIAHAHNAEENANDHNESIERYEATTSRQIKQQDAR